MIFSIKDFIDYLYNINWSNTKYINYFEPVTGMDVPYEDQGSNIEFSQEEIDYFQTKSTLIDEDDKYCKYIDSTFPVLPLKVTANIATNTDRINTLLLTLDSIKDQFDEIRIYLNDYNFIPKELENYSIYYGDDLTDNAKFIWSELENEYYFVIDDDIIYPPDYVEKTLPLIGERIVCYSGKKINTSSLDTYFTNHRTFESFNSLEREVEIDIVDTSTMAFNTNIVYPTLWRTRNFKMSNLLMSLECTLHNIPIVCLPHKANWIKSIYRKGIRKDFSEIGDKRQSDFLKMISLYKDLPQNELGNDNIFGRIDKESLIEVANEINKFTDLKNLYYIGCGIGTNILHLSLITNLENYFGFDTEEYRIRFARKILYGSSHILTKKIHFVNSDLSKIVYDENSVIVINPYIEINQVFDAWKRSPSNTVIITFNEIPTNQPLSILNVKMMNSQSTKLYFYRKQNCESINLTYKNIPLTLSQPSKCSSVIPKIIHHIAPQDRERWLEKWHFCYETWIDNFPNFEHKIWDDLDILNFIRQNYPWYEKIYESYDRNIKRYDMARVLILYHFGGIYADMDYMVFTNFYDSLPKDKVSTPLSPYPLNEFIQNALFASPKGHRFWLSVLDRSIDKIHLASVLESTGPRLITECYFLDYKHTKNEINILPSEIYNPSYTSPYFESSNLICKHFCTNSWTLKVRNDAIWTDDLN